MVIALLTTDNREPFREYHKSEPWFGAAPEALLQGFALLPEAKIHVVSCTQQPVAAPQKLGDNIWFHSLHVPKLGWMRSLYQGCVRAVRKELRGLKPNLVHGQGTERECALSAVFSGFPNVLTIHGNMKAMLAFNPAHIGSFHWLAARLETLALRKTAGVFCNSAYTEGMVSPRTRRVWRVPNALRPAFFDPAPEVPRQQPPVVLNVGVLSPRKQQLEILEVGRRLWQRGFRFEIHFIGDRGPQTAYGARFATRLAEAERDGYARHIGSLPPDRLIETFDRAAGLIHFPAEEAFGLVVGEALARNLKFFGARVGGVGEIAAGAEGAELLSVGDWAGLEQGLARWLEAGCLRPADSRAVMRVRYHPEVIAREHLRIYREVLNSRR